MTMTMTMMIAMTMAILIVVRRLVPTAWNKKRWICGSCLLNFPLFEQQKSMMMIDYGDDNWWRWWQWWWLSQDMWQTQQTSPQIGKNMVFVVYVICSQYQMIWWSKTKHYAGWAKPTHPINFCGLFLKAYMGILMYSLTPSLWGAVIEVFGAVVGANIGNNCRLAHG